MVFLRPGAALLTVLCAIVPVGGCATTSESPKSATDTTPASQTAHDVSRIAELDGEFPPDFIPVPISGPNKVGHQVVGTVGTVVSYGKPFTVVPPQCHALLKPVDALAGADSMHIRGDGLEYRSIAIGAVTPVTISAEIPAGCDRVTYTVDDEKLASSGVVERIAAPSIDGASTMALKIQADGSPDVEYLYAATLDDRAYVDVQARLAPTFVAQPLLPDLLAKAVDAVRGK